MTAPDLAAALLRDVPKDALAKIIYEAMRFERQNETPEWVDGGNAIAQDEARRAGNMVQNAVLAALSRALNPALSERAGEVLEGVTPGPWVTGTMLPFTVFNPNPKDNDDSGVICDCQEPANARFIAWCREGVQALMAQNAALRAELDEHAEALKVNNAVLCAALLRAKDAEAPIAALPAATVGVPLKQIGTGLYEQPAPNPAAIREAWEKAYWRMRSYAVHDNDCKLNKPPHFDGPCSCGLTAALEDALALIQMEEQK